MKCPECNGKGTVLKIIYEDWQKDEIVRGAVKCQRCNGSGEVPLTNEEWLNTLSTTEEKAEAIFECVMANSWNFNKDGIKRWLKQPHGEE